MRHPTTCLRNRTSPFPRRATRRRPRSGPRERPAGRSGGRVPTDRDTTGAGAGFRGVGTGSFPTG
jgi:hypothetical protein